MKELIIISGNIGAGKSTFMNNFVKMLQDVVDKRVILVEEGIETDKIFKEKLTKYYSDPSYRIEFQSYLTEFRQSRLKDYPDNSILVSERGLMDDVVFSNATSLELENVNGDYIKYYYDLIRRLKYDYPKVLANIYLRTDPYKCLENIKLRGRKEEREIDLLYIKTLHHCHEAFLPTLSKKFDYPLISFDFNNHTDHEKVFNYIFKEIKPNLSK